RRTVRGCECPRRLSRLLLLFLADEAPLGPGHGLEPLGIDGLAALLADAEVPFRDAGEGLLDLLQHLALGLGEAEEELACVGARRLVALGLVLVVPGLAAVHARLAVRLEDLVLLALEGLVQNRDLTLLHGSLKRLLARPGAHDAGVRAPVN